MCGIVGIVAQRPVAQMLLDGLQKLEYRGYDSAGMAVVSSDKKLHCLRVVGKVHVLAQAIAEPENRAYWLEGTGIAHTRWATHGEPAICNAHPLVSHDAIALVHNGIIENYSAIRQRLKADGFEFQSQTDTEVIVHLIYQYYEKTHNLLQAVHSAIQELKGAYALAVIAANQPGYMIAVREGSPLVVGYGPGEYYVASDPLALLALTQEFVYLADGDIAELTLAGITVYDKTQVVVMRDHNVLTIAQDTTERGEYRHFMLKEIMEQPRALRTCMQDRINAHEIIARAFEMQNSQLFAQAEYIQFVACGTSYHAALVAKYWWEELLGIAVGVEVASEFRYRNFARPKNSLFIVLSQSGETADTLAALRLAKTVGYLATCAICNVAGSSMTREADFHILTHAGIEIGVASTKAFTTQLLILLLFGCAIQQAKNNTSIEQNILRGCIELPEVAEQVLKVNAAMLEWAHAIIDKQHAIFLGRGVLYPIALEGALKMKEISYIHAEAFPAGELKHGPLALVDRGMPVIAMLPGGKMWEKNFSNLQEVLTRGGQVFILTDVGSMTVEESAVFSKLPVVKLPQVNSLLIPFIYTLPLQLLAYHAAVLKGTDVDQPRNLAKSVTVE